MVRMVDFHGFETLGERTHGGDDGIDRGGRHHGDQLALVGDVEWVQAQHLARGANRARNGNGLLAQIDAHPGRGRDLVER
jgi:hypothetical protein